MLYNADNCALELSVRELCEMAHRSGSIDARYPMSKHEAMKKGGELHRKLQSKEGPSYQAEVFLRYTTLYDGIFYTVTGRADGVFEENGKVTVEEIKTARGRYFSGMRDSAHAQLRCYAFFLAEEKKLSRVRMRMRVVNTETEQVKDAYSEMTREELREFYFSLLARIAPFGALEAERVTERIPTVQAITFPSKTRREGQAELAEAVFRAVRRGERLFAQAPTGIGKTMSTLYPAVKAIGEGICERVFYLTARASVRREAYAAAAKLFESGARLRTITLYAKEQMCLCDGGCKNGAVSRCNPVDCPYARGYYDRVDTAILELVSRANGFPRSILLEIARKHRICPYELSLDLSRFCEIIICDYNYVFDPAVYLRRYFDAEEGEHGKYVFLVDEAHNLPDRTRDMYSATLAAADFEAVYARVDPVKDSELEVALGGFLMTLKRQAALCTENRVKHEDGTESGYYLNRAPFIKFFEEVNACRREIDRVLKSEPEHALTIELAELSSRLKRFSLIAMHYDDRFLTYLELQHGVFSMKIYCLDPSGVLNTCASRAVAAVYFSATLTPLEYFASVLGGGKQAQTLSLASPYSAENLCITAVTSISTRMEDRARSYKKVATYIAAAVSGKMGNYMVYFPSYDYLEHVKAAFVAKYPHVTLIYQHPHMTVGEREAFLAAFKEDEGHLRVGFCVLGGSFSEGVDLPGSRLIGTVIVGVGIPGLSSERNILRDYYETTVERGYDYAYTYPGMNRVLQAAGRVIRREEDKGIVVLIDTRYGEEPYLHLYPPHWEGMVAAGDAASLAHRVRTFWERQK